MRQRWFPHYAWLILAGVVVVQMVSAGVRVSFGVLLDPLVEAFGWSRGGISLAYTLQFLIGIPIVLMVGRLAERITTRYMVMAILMLSWLIIIKPTRYGSITAAPISATPGSPWAVQIAWTSPRETLTATVTSMLSWLILEPTRCG